MQDLSQLANIFTIANVWLVFKLGYLLAFLLYVAFAVIVIAQIRQMVDTLNGQIDGLLKSLGWLHLAVAVTAFVTALIIL